MKKPDLPTNEAERLHSLHSLGILDTPPEERFDRLTRLAKRLFDVPIALVSLVDENRQWFKSAQGLPVRETPRDISFCGHAILDHEVFVIPDASLDPRFADNPLVTGEPGIRFYAGCPITAPDGARLGTLCVIDTRPRQIAGEDKLALRDLATLVENEISAFRLATMDELTGISNRRGFLYFAQQSLAFCKRQGVPAALVFLDLDDFKEVNDGFGHAEGDAALKAFAAMVRSSFRESDCCGRLGGDEFAVFLANATKPQAQTIMARFYTTLQRYNERGRRGYDIACSHGIVELKPREQGDIMALLEAGDSLMYQRKLGQRGPT